MAVCLPTFIFFCVQQKKETREWTRKWRQNDDFLVNCPFLSRNQHKLSYRSVRNLILHKVRFRSTAQTHCMILYTADEAQTEGLSPRNKSNPHASLRLVGHGAGPRPLVVAAVHFLFHGSLLVQTLAGVVGDLQKAAGLHHHVWLAGVGHDGVLRDHLTTNTHHMTSATSKQPQNDILILW